jgi:RND family efflux transporter MFP subunit
MNASIDTLRRVGLTLVLTLVALFVAWRLWAYYMLEPWTRDGRVRADVVQIAPDVSGLVMQVLVHDNQVVKAGDTLFVIDRSRYEQAVKQARAALLNTRSQLAQAEREDKRNWGLTNLVSTEQREQGSSRSDELRASEQAAQAALDMAQINLERTEVKASVNGPVTNVDLRPGTYAVAGHPLLALVDQDSLYVVGYFEENKIPRIRVGDAANVRLLGESVALQGHVESIAGGIDDRERGASSNLLANVNPTFNWVRLPQRIPVRVKLDAASTPESDQVRLIMGRTATVEVIARKGSTS